MDSGLGFTQSFTFSTFTALYPFRIVATQCQNFKKNHIAHPFFTMAEKLDKTNYPYFLLNL